MLNSGLQTFIKISKLKKTIREDKSEQETVQIDVVSIP